MQPAMEKLNELYSKLTDITYRRSIITKISVRRNLLGISLFVHTNNQLILDVLDDVLVKFTRCHQRQNARPVNLFLFENSYKEEEVDDCDLGRPTVQLGYRDWLLITSRDDCIAFVDFKNQTAVAFINSQVLKRKSDLDDFMLEVIYRFIERQQIGVFHAAGVYSKNTAILFLGPDGSGKSTMAFALALSRGYELIGDSFVYFWQKNSGFMLGGYPAEMVRLLPEAIEMAQHDLGYGSSGTQTVDKLKKSKTAIHFAHVSELRASRSCVQPNKFILLFPKFSKGQPAVEKLDPREALVEAILDSVHYDTSKVLEERTAIYQALIMAPQCNCYRLLLTGNLAADLLCLENL